MKNRLIRIALFVALAAGLILIFYPQLSTIGFDFKQSIVIQRYKNAVGALSAKKAKAALEQAQAYNQDLYRSGISVLDTSGYKQFDPEGSYNSLLDFDGVMGYITIPKIHVALPIYHGTSSAVLLKGIGHLEGSSLPVGGQNTHAVLTGHTGLESARLFTDLDKMELGDEFDLSVAGRTLTYRVDQIKTVLPYETGDLKIFPGHDYVTLITCTPYHINSHRLLVRGTRVTTAQKKTAASVRKTNSTPLLAKIWPIFPAAAAAVVLAAVIIRGKKKKN